MAIALTRPAALSVPFGARAMLATATGVLGALAGFYADAEALSRELESAPPARRQELALRWFANHARTV